MEPIVLIILVVLVLLVVLGRGTGSLSGLIINGIVGVVLLFLTNLVLQPPIPINVLTVLVCAIGGSIPASCIARCIVPSKTSKASSRS